MILWYAEASQEWAAIRVNPLYFFIPPGSAQHSIPSAKQARARCLYRRGQDPVAILTTASEEI